MISHPNFGGEYKVGIAQNEKKRLAAYQTSDPKREYRIEFKLETPDFRELEKHIHKTFPNKHEWVQG
ncbi:MAG: GIY-YIG nuclease family protein, partial [Gammaproteobacteria bacterium]|nr:GIY-YIG nuclease family protein [Gammaproteobacteria bacterium]